jgi:hypothetical protein
LLTQNSSVWKLIPNFFQGSKKLKRIFISLTNFEKDDLFLKQYVKRELLEFSSNDESFFSERIKTQIEESTEYPIAQVISFINLFEQRRLNLNEIFGLVISAVLGGSMGALLTMLLSGNQ